ncbi:MAG: alpha/beta hydrolase [bacterium]|nr:alpha/beta hydrolase [bacterium]
MRETTSSFTNLDGLKIHTISWLPQAAPKAAVLIVHGIAEHSARYRHVAEHLTGRGYAVYSFDHRGHGRSEGGRAYFDNFDQPVADVEQVFNQIKMEHPDLPIFVLGHSMGALVGLLFTLRHQEKLAGFISSGTPLLLYSIVPAPLRSILGVLQNLLPTAYLIPLDVNAISRDKTIVAVQKADPLVHHRPLPLRTIHRLIERAKEAEGQLGTLRLPLLILHGDADTITPPAGSPRLVEKAASADKTLKLYPGMYHEIVNEIGKEEVLADIGNWLDAHVK